MSSTMPGRCLLTTKNVVTLFLFVCLVVLDGRDLRWFFYVALEFTENHHNPAGFGFVCFKGKLLCIFGWSETLVDWSLNLPYFPASCS